MKHDAGKIIIIGGGIAGLCAAAHSNGKLMRQGATFVTSRPLSRQSAGNLASPRWTTSWPRSTSSS